MTPASLLESLRRLPAGLRDDEALATITRALHGPCTDGSCQACVSDRALQRAGKTVERLERERDAAHAEASRYRGALEAARAALRDTRRVLMEADGCIYHLDPDSADVNSRLVHQNINAALSPAPAATAGPACTECGGGLWTASHGPEGSHTYQPPFTPDSNLTPDGTMVIDPSKPIDLMAALRSHLNPAPPPLPEKPGAPVTPTDLLKEGGDWLGAARNWMKWNCRMGDRVTWGSEELVGEFSARMCEEIAAHAVAADRAAQARHEETIRMLRDRVLRLELGVDAKPGAGGAMTGDARVEHFRKAICDMRLYYARNRNAGPLLDDLEERVAELAASPSTATAGDDGERGE